MLLQVLIFAIMAIAIGLALTFFGYATFRILFPIWGFLVGLWLGAQMMAGFSGGGFLATSIGLIVGFFLGMVFAALAYYVYAFAVILFGATLGFAIGQGFITLLGFNQGAFSWLIGVVFAILFAMAFMSMKLPKVLLMVLTAFAGASAMIAGVLALFGQIPPSRLGLAFVQPYIHQSWFWWLIWIGLGFFGVMAQYAMSEAANSPIPPEYAYDVTIAEQGKKAKKTEPKVE